MTQILLVGGCRVVKGAKICQTFSRRKTLPTKRPFGLLKKQSGLERCLPTQEHDSWESIGSIIRLHSDKALERRELLERRLSFLFGIPTGGRDAVAEFCFVPCESSIAGSG